MPFGKYMALWRALLNYPKTFSSCTFITPRKEKQGEGSAFKGSALAPGRLIEIRLQKDVDPEQHCLADHPTESFMACQANISSGLSVTMTKPREKLKPTLIRLHLHSSLLFFLTIISFNFSHKRKTRQTITGSIFRCQLSRNSLHRRLRHKPSFSLVDH